MLVNNAARDDRHRIEAVTPEYFDERIAVNLRHQFFAAQAIAPAMAQGRRRLDRQFRLDQLDGQEPGNAGLSRPPRRRCTGLTRGLARDLGADAIRVNTVVPGWIMTERQIKLWLTPEGERELIEEAVPAGEALSARHRPHGAVAGRGRQPPGDGAELHRRWRAVVIYLCARREFSTPASPPTLTLPHKGEGTDGDTERKLPPP